MRNKEQKYKLVETLNEQLKGMPRLISIIYFDESSTGDFVEVVTEENMLAINVVKIYHTLNLAGLRCVQKLDDVDFDDDKGKFIKCVDIYYFNFA